MALTRIVTCVFVYPQGTVTASGFGESLDSNCRARVRPLPPEARGLKGAVGAFLDREHPLGGYRPRAVPRGRVDAERAMSAPALELPRARDVSKSPFRDNPAGIQATPNPGTTFRHPLAATSRRKWRGVFELWALGHRVAWHHRGHRAGERARIQHALHRNTWGGAPAKGAQPTQATSLTRDAVLLLRKRTAMPSISPSHMVPGMGNPLAHS